MVVLQKRRTTYHVNWRPLGSGCSLQKMSKQIGLDVRVRHGRYTKVQRGSNDLGKGSCNGKRRDRRPCYGTLILILYSSIILVQFSYMHCQIIIMCQCKAPIQSLMQP